MFKATVVPFAILPLEDVADVRHEVAAPRAAAGRLLLLYSRSRIESIFHLTSSSRFDT